MIAKLRGIVDTVGVDYAILDVSGVGYHVFASAETLRSLPAKGESAVLLIETHVREDHIHLYGFATTEEKEWFKYLFTVQGVGGRVALAILSVMPLNQLIQALAAEDKKSLTRASGVGPKLAGRLVIELKEKARKLSFMTQPKDQPQAVQYNESMISQEAISALINLGYSSADAFQSVTSVTSQLGDDVSLDKLIRISLQELSK
jgi:holliday junction DNA helicase RuvA